MTGLDTSQELTDQASLRSEDFHVHSRPKPAEGQSDVADQPVEAGEPATPPDVEPTGQEGQSAAR
jgi:hypothetical protein